MENIVIGSGPAGVAVSKALIEQGCEVTMVDAGYQIEEEASALRQRLAKVSPQEWREEDRQAMLTPEGEGDSGLMRPFGSSFMSERPNSIFEDDKAPQWFGLRPSFVKGGLSNGWGASILPYRDTDIQDWPIGESELAPHYAAVSKFVPQSAADDGLTTLFSELNTDEHLRPSSQAAEILKRLGASKEQLTASGVCFGQSRQALSSACRYCAMCLHGCPYDVVFNAAQVVEDLIAHPNFTYCGGELTESFQEESERVQVNLRNLKTDEKSAVTGQRLFVAVGVLPTAKLVLESLGKYDHPVVMKDSQHFFLPSVHKWSNAVNPSTEERHALAQIFLECTDTDVSARTVHSQVYTYNDAYVQDMRQRFGSFAKVLDPFIAFLSQRLIVAQTFLHSDDSASVEIRLSSGEKKSLTFKSLPNTSTSSAITRSRTRMAMVLRKAGLVPLMPLSRAGEIGSSFHCGGTFPMREAPTGLETDLLGRVNGLTRTHIVDASIFPSIPATTITLSVMANAHRIGSLARSLDA